MGRRMDRRTRIMALAVAEPSLLLNLALEIDEDVADRSAALPVDDPLLGRLLGQPDVVLVNRRARTHLPFVSSLLRSSDPGKNKKHSRHAEQGREGC
jgi:hypothetical protein